MNAHRYTGEVIISGDYGGADPRRESGLWGGRDAEGMKPRRARGHPTHSASSTTMLFITGFDSTLIFHVSLGLPATRMSDEQRCFYADSAKATQPSLKIHPWA